MTSLPMPRGAAVPTDTRAHAGKAIPIALLVLFVLAPKAGVVDFSGLVLGVWFLVAWLMGSRRIILSDDGSLLVPLLWVTLLGLACVAYLVYGQVSAEIIFKPVRQLVLLTMLIYLFRQYELTAIDALKAALVAAAANGLVVILQYVLDAMHIAPDFLIMPGFDASINVPFRKPGLTAGYPVAGMLAVFGIVIAASWLRARRAGWVVLCLLLCMVSVTVTSRMALLFGIVAIVVLVVPAAVARPRLLILYGTIALAGVIAFQRYSGLLHYDTIGVMFELFINLSQGQVETKSTTALIESYGLLPDKLLTLLIGNGTYNLSDSGLNVDAGFQSIMFSAGGVALLLYVALSWCYFRKAWSAVRGTYFSTAVVLLYVMVMVANLKTDAFFSRSFGDAWLLIVAAGYGLLRDDDEWARPRADRPPDEPPGPAHSRLPGYV